MSRQTCSGVRGGPCHTIPGEHRLSDTPIPSSTGIKRCCPIERSTNRQRSARISWGFDLDPISLVDQALDSAYNRRCNDSWWREVVDGVLVARLKNPFIRLKLDWDRFSIATLGFVMSGAVFLCGSESLLQCEPGVAEIA